MPEPALATLAAQSAAKAVGGLVMRVSTPAAKSVLARLRPAPAAVRRSGVWAETKRARAEREAIAKYLGGRLCQGLLEILAMLELSEDDTGRAGERRELAETFRRELGKRLRLPGEQVTTIAEALWWDLHDCVRLHVVELRNEGTFVAADLTYVAGLSGTPVHPGGGRMLGTVAERAAVSVDHERVRLAHAAVEVVRQSALERYAKLVMPHSREDYLVPIERLYVKRSLRPTAITMPGAGQEPPDGELDELVPVPEDEVVERRFVVVGNPGAGKSTYIRHLLFRTAGLDGDDGVAPLVVELKDHQTPPDSFVTALTTRMRQLTQADLTREAIRDTLLLGLAMVVFDGLDEIGDIDERRRTVEAINAFARRYPLARVVVTAREEGYPAARLDPALFPVLRLPDFTNDQVEFYARQWFAIAGDGSGNGSDTLAERFIEDSAHVGDVRTNPLMLSLLCLIYRYEGYIPENRPDVYEECAELLFERWDLLRRVPISINRSGKAKYLVQELGYYFFNRERTLGGETESRLRAIVTDYFERDIVGGVDSARQRAQAFLDYCAGRAWLLTHVGTSERGERLFGFTHRTFMEYYAARYIVRHCRNARELVTMIRPLLVLGTSEVVPQIAIQQFEDKNEHGIDECLMLLVFDAVDAPTDRRLFLDFALRALRYMRPSARTMARLFTVAMAELGRTLDRSLAALLLGIPDDTHELLVASCEQAMSASSATGIEGEGDDFGPLGHAAQQRAGADQAALRTGAAIIHGLLGPSASGRVARDIAERLLLSETELPRLLDAGLTTVARDHVDVITDLNRRGVYATSSYVRVLGARALVALPAGSGDLGYETAGRLVELLGDFFIRETLHPDLRLMLGVVYGAPSSVVPMNPQIVSALLDTAGHTDLGGGILQASGAFNARVIERHFPTNGPHDSLGLRMVYAAAVCASYDYERMGTAAMQTDRSWRVIALVMPGLDVAVRRALHPGEDDRPDIDRADLAAAVLGLCDRLKADGKWTDAFRRWAAGDSLFCS